MKENNRVHWICFPRNISTTFKSPRCVGRATYLNMVLFRRIETVVVQHFAGLGQQSRAASQSVSVRRYRSVQSFRFSAMFHLHLSFMAVIFIYQIRFHFNISFLCIASALESHIPLIPTITSRIIFSWESNNLPESSAASSSVNCGSSFPTRDKFDRLEPFRTGDFTPRGEAWALAAAYFLSGEGGGVLVEETNPPSLSARSSLAISLSRSGKAFSNAWLRSDVLISSISRL